jgi:shikimate 5-dehydrogenase
VVTLPPSPESPTVYLITETAIDSGARDLLETGIAALAAGPCAIENLTVGPSLGERDRAEILEFLQDAYNARGALVIGPAQAFFDDAPGTYDEIEAACHLLGEVGIIRRVPGALHAAAPRLTACTRAANRILPAETTEVLILGAGPDARALAAALASNMCHALPAKVTLASNNALGLNIARHRLKDATAESRLEIRHVQSVSEYDRLLALLPPDSAVIQALGPTEADMTQAGSATLFPMGSVIWDTRSDASKSRFLAAAVRQRDAARLTLSDQTAFRTERDIAILEALFAEPGDETMQTKLRKAIT